MSETRFQDLPVKNVFNNATRARLAETSMTLRKAVGVTKSKSLFKDAVASSGVNMEELTAFISSTIEKINKGETASSSFTVDRKFYVYFTPYISVSIEFPNESINLSLISDALRGINSSRIMLTGSITPIKADFLKSMIKTAMHWFNASLGSQVPPLSSVSLRTFGTHITSRSIAQNASYVALKKLVKELQIEGVFPVVVQIFIDQPSDDGTDFEWEEYIRMGNNDTNGNNSNGNNSNGNNSNGNSNGNNNGNSNGNSNNNSNGNSSNGNTNARKRILGEYDERLRAPFKTSQAISAFLPSSGPKPEGKNVSKLIMDRASQLQSQVKSKSKTKSK